MTRKRPVTRVTKKKKKARRQVAAAIPSPDNVDALLSRIQRKGEKRIKKAIAGAIEGVIASAVTPTLQEGASNFLSGLHQLDAMLGDEEEDDVEDDERDEEE